MSVQRIRLQPECRTWSKIPHGAGEFPQLLTKWAISLVFLVYGFTSGIISSYSSLCLGEGEVSCSVHHCPEYTIFFSVIVSPVYINNSHLISFPQILIIQILKEKKR